MAKKYFPPASLKPGYFLGQEAFSVPENAMFRRLDPYFETFLTEDGATRFFEQIAGKVDGLDYVNYWYDPADAEMGRKIAEIGRTHGVDMWAGIRWQKQFRDMPVVPGDLVAWTMEESGQISPAVWEQRNHVFDPLNPNAVDWLLDVLEDRYWPHVKGAVNGFFFPECRITTWDFPYRRSGLKPWTLHAYSPAVFEKWQAYCAEHDIRWKGVQVDRFPVPKAKMTSEHPDRTVYIPDNRPEKVPSFTRFADIPRGNKVWLAWEDFLCGLYHETFVHRISARVNRYHADEPDWRGVCFFNNDVTMLDYRNFKTRSARTGIEMGYWPQGRRMGVDLPRLLKDREITCFISETIQSVRDYLFYEENFLSNGMELAREAGRKSDYGFMVHYCDHWGQVDGLREKAAGIMDDIEEDLRWEMIHKYRPPVISFYSIPAVLVKEGAWYRKGTADRFWKRLAEYKREMQKAE